jgi:hypothetical protein
MVNGLKTLLETSNNNLANHSYFSDQAYRAFKVETPI